MTRRALLSTLTAALLAGAMPAPSFAQAMFMTAAPAETQGVAIAEGEYRGIWTNGAQVFQTIRVISSDLITMIAHDHTAQPVPYQRIGEALYRDARGNTIAVASRTQLIWTQNQGGARVTYNLN